MKLLLLRYLFAGIFLLTGFYLIAKAINKDSNDENPLNKKYIPLSGKEGKIHMIYLGLLLILLAVYFLAKTN